VTFGAWALFFWFCVVESVTLTFEGLSAEGVKMDLQ
jgi:hypothetical protein